MQRTSCSPVFWPSLWRCLPCGLVAAVLAARAEQPWIAWCLLALPVLMAGVLAWDKRPPTHACTRHPEPSLFWLCMRRLSPLALLLAACVLWGWDPLLALICLAAHPSSM
jgi:hypothetical protein